MENGNIRTHMRIQYRAICYWFKLNMKQEEDIKHQAKIMEKGIDCWSARIKAYLDNLGFGYLWSGEQTSSTIKKAIKQRIEDVGFTFLREETEELTSLYHYRTLKTEQRRESYTTECKRTRRCCAILRLNLKRSLPIHLSSMICKFCC